MRCDLHVHTKHSGRFGMPVLRHFCRESYSEPEAVYERLKRRGMDLVTITDHDSMEAAEPLRHYPDFFLSEEVTVRMPSGTQAHVGVYDITERQHAQIQRRRNDLPALLAYLSEKRLFYSINHLYSSLTGERRAEDYQWFARWFPAVETRNGQMIARLNRAAERFAAEHGQTAVGGSDAHALASAGSVWTEVPGAYTREEFLAGLGAGRARVAGSHGGFARLTRDVYLIGLGLVREQPWAWAMALLAPAVPLFTLCNLLHEIQFGRAWACRTNLQVCPGSAYWAACNRTEWVTNRGFGVQGSGQTWRAVLHEGAMA